MKQLLITALAATAAAAVYGQGTVFVDNTANSGVFNGNGGTAANPVFSTLVTQNGLIFTTDVTEQEGTLGGTAGSTLIGTDFSWALYAGTSASSLTLLASETGGSITGDNAVYGGVQNPLSSSYSVPGSTAGSSVFLELYVWEGSTYSTYDAAFAAGDYTGVSGVFSNPTGGSGSPPGPGAALSGMPDILVTVPEPGTMALAALGGASLLLFRRKK